jgi:hypothetical protein
LVTCKIVTPLAVAEALALPPVPAPAEEVGKSELPPVAVAVAWAMLRPRQPAQR